MDEFILRYLDELRRRANSEYVPVMREGTCKLLADLAREIRPEEILEIGTCWGVSGATALCAGGRLTTIDIDGAAQDVAEKVFSDLGLRQRVNFIEGDCYEQLRYLSDCRYDLIILDGPKGHYAELYDTVEPMLNAGGAIFADDIGYHGLTDGAEYPEHKHRTIVRGMREFIQKVKDDSDMVAEFSDIEDGVAIIRKQRTARKRVANVELLAPAGDMVKLKTALHFGADAVYFAGKKFGLRAYADNFDYEGIKTAVELTHRQGKKAYVTVNIFASNDDFGELRDYLEFLQEVGTDGIIVSDPGVFALAGRVAPRLELHISTQANVTNKYTAAFWRDEGAKRIVLARELNLKQIAEIADYIGGDTELEAFIHGAMCISYSGRCLLSSYLTDRDSNRGECVQACRWEYVIAEKSRTGNPLTLQEDERGSYILNSRDMNTMPILDKIIDAGVTSLKIEGRMKSEYYVGCAVNAYRKRIDGIMRGDGYDESLNAELDKVNHREYTTGFYLGKATQCYNTSKPDNDYVFAASVLGYDEQNKRLEVEMRNRFKKGDTLEAVSSEGFYDIKVDRVFDTDGNEVEDCKIVQQKLFIENAPPLKKYDILRLRKA